MSPLLPGQQEPSVSLLPMLSSVQAPTPLRSILPSKLKKHSVATSFNKKQSHAPSINIRKKNILNRIVSRAMPYVEVAVMPFCEQVPNS